MLFRRKPPGSPGGTGGQFDHHGTTGASTGATLGGETIRPDALKGTPAGRALPVPWVFDKLTERFPNGMTRDDCILLLDEADAEGEEVWDGVGRMSLANDSSISTPDVLLEGVYNGWLSKDVPYDQARDQLRHGTDIQTGMASVRHRGAQAQAAIVLAALRHGDDPQWANDSANMTSLLKEIQSGTVVDWDSGHDVHLHPGLTYLHPDIRVLGPRENVEWPRYQLTYNQAPRGEVTGLSTRPTNIGGYAMAGRKSPLAFGLGGAGYMPRPPEPRDVLSVMVPGAGRPRRGSIMAVMGQHLSS